MEIPSELIERLAGAKRVAALTGAGVSAESRVPTFRDAQMLERVKAAQGGRG